MSFSGMEASARSGRPVEAYVFTVGGGRNIAYTNSTVGMIVPHDGAAIFCEPIPINRGSIRSTGSTDSAELEITVPEDASILSEFESYPPSVVVQASVYRQQRGDTSGEWKRLWMGRVTGIGVKNGQGVVGCESIAGVVVRPGLRRNFQYTCPHVLYGPACKAPRIPVNVTVASTDAAGTLFFSGENAFAPYEKDDFYGGVVEWTAAGEQQIRGIVRLDIVDGNIRVVLSGRSAVPVGAVLSFYRGCAHNTDDCRVKFNNILNYGGQPWIPTKNPINKISTFY